MTPSTAINGMYTLLCQDPDTAAGGLTPYANPYHAPAFMRLESGRLEDLAPLGMDRRIHIEYAGTEAWHTLGNMQTFGVTVRVGYFAGASDPEETRAVMFDDEHLIGAALSYSGNWYGAALTVGPGDVTQIGDDCFINEIPVSVQIA